MFNALSLPVVREWKPQNEIKSNLTDAVVFGVVGADTAILTLSSS